MDVEAAPATAAPLSASEIAATSSQPSAGPLTEVMAGDIPTAPKAEADVVPPVADADAAADAGPAAGAVGHGCAAPGQPMKAEGVDGEAGAGAAAEVPRAEGEDGGGDGGAGEDDGPGLPPLPETAQLLADSCGWTVSGRIEVR